MILTYYNKGGKAEPWPLAAGMIIFPWDQRWPVSGGTFHQPACQHLCPKKEKSCIYPDVG